MARYECLLSFFLLFLLPFRHLFRSILRTCSTKVEDAFDAVETETVTAPVGTGGGPLSLSFEEDIFFSSFCARVAITPFLFFSLSPLSLSFRERNGRRRGSRRRLQPRRRQCSCLLYINIRNIWWRRGRRRRPRGSCCCCCCFGTGDRRRCRRFNRIVLFESRCTQTLRISVGVDDRGAFCYLRAGGTERVLGSGGPGPGLLRCVFKQSCLS